MAASRVLETAVIRVEISGLPTMQAGPLMIRHIINGHEILLPCDAKLHPKLTLDNAVDEEPLGGTY